MDKTPHTPPPETLQVPANRMENALQRLNDAAQRIAFVEQHNKKKRRGPKASRLAPLRDISAEIQYANTPRLPPTSYSTQQLQEDQRDPKEASGDSLPDFWPWLDDANDVRSSEADKSEESSNDSWANHTDPLLRRSFPLPRKTEEIFIEEQETRPLAVLTVPLKALHPAALTLSNIPTIAIQLLQHPSIAAQMLRRSIYRQDRKQLDLRGIFICLSILALLALIVDGFLASNLLTPHTNRTTVNSPPTLTLSANVVKYGQSIALGLRHFPPSTSVLLSHNIGETLKLNTNTPLVQVGKNGSADVTVFIENSWEPGLHTIEAEDTQTRYTASTTLRLDSGSTQPSRLTVSPAQLDLGAAIQGANSIQPVMLRNTGDGAISWSASSNASWLLLAPNQGNFSGTQTIEIGVQRANLKPDHYSGTITFTANTGDTRTLSVQMTVKPLPGNAGPVLTATPALLAFNAFDGGVEPRGQLLQISNPGTQPLYWSIEPYAQLTQPATPGTVTPETGWLATDQTRGSVEPGGTELVTVFVHSRNLLPGTYLSTLNITTQSGNTALNSPQTVGIALTIQRACGVTVSSTNLSFTAVANQTAPGNQALTLTGTPNCANAIAWNATMSASWLTMTPTSGQLRSAANAVTTVGVNTSGLQPGAYKGEILLTTEQSTQTVNVQLTVQAIPSPAAPILSASPLNLTFSTTTGLANPPGQTVTITNTGGSPLQLQTAVSQQASSWLSASSTSMTIAAGKTGQLTVSVDATALAAGSYTGQVTLSGSADNAVAAGGSPQTITVNLTVQPPCKLAQPSPSVLALNTIRGDANSSAQVITITATGNCSWPLNWKATVSAGASWLKLSATSGILNASGQSTTLTTVATSAGLAPGTYTARVSIAASDAANQPAQGSPQVFTITQTVQQPCSLRVARANLSLSVKEGQTTAAQNLSFSQAGSCSLPIDWTATVDKNSSNWLVLSATSGSDNGNGSSIGVSANAAQLSPGTYTGTITIAASDQTGTAIQGSPQNVTVTLTVTGLTVNGTVNACSSNPCDTSAPLANATVTITTSSGTTIGGASTDSSGNFSINGIPAGTYNIAATGSDGNKQNYSGSKTVTITGDQQNVSLNVFPSS